MWVGHALYKVSRSVYKIIIVTVFAWDEVRRKKCSNQHSNTDRDAGRINDKHNYYVVVDRDVYCTLTCIIIIVSDLLLRVTGCLLMIQ